MIYYLTFKNSKAEISDNNIIGEVSFKNFHTGIAWIVLNKLIDENKINVLHNIEIRNSLNQKLSIEEFLDIIKNYNIIRY